MGKRGAYMKLIISMQDGSVEMLSINRIACMEFGDTAIAILDSITDETKIYLYKGIRSIVIA